MTATDTRRQCRAMQPKTSHKTQQDCDLIGPSETSLNLIRTKMSLNLHRLILIACVATLVLAQCSPYLQSALAQETGSSEEPTTTTLSAESAASESVTTTTEEPATTTTTTTKKPEKAKIPPINFTLVDELFDAAFEEQEVIAKWKHMDKQLLEGKSRR